MREAQQEFQIIEEMHNALSSQEQDSFPIGNPLRKRDCSNQIENQNNV